MSRSVCNRSFARSARIGAAQNSAKAAAYVLGINSLFIVNLLCWLVAYIFCEFARLPTVDILPGLMSIIDFPLFGLFALILLIFAI